MTPAHKTRIRALFVLGFFTATVGFCLLANSSSVSVQAKQKDDAWPKITDPLFPKTKDDVATGYAACSACHAQTLPINAKVNVFAKNFKSHEFVLLSEGGTWLTEDPHSAAFRVLSLPLGQQMAKILKYDVTKAPQCLTCHAIDKYPGMPLPKDINIAERFDTADGVTCNACHGVRKAWQGEHYADQNKTIPWRIHSPAEKESKGMRNLRDPVVKAKLCASCHVGDPDQHRVVTHDMYAAGHPPLPPFELGTFMQCEPMHWGAPSGGYEESKDDKKMPKLKFFSEAEFAAYPGGADIAKKNPNWMWDLYRVHPEEKEISLARAISAGSVASLHAEMRLIAADADAVMKGDEGAVDFARFDCYACHHDLKIPSDRQARGYAGVPGRPPLKAWVAALPGVVVDHAAGLKPFTEASKDFRKNWDAVQTSSLARPFGLPKDLSRDAKEMAKWCETFLKVHQTEAAPIYTKAEAEKLLSQIGDAAVSKQWVADPEAAMHLSWAYIALRSHMKDKIDEKAMSQLRTVVPARVREPRMEDGKPTFSNDKGDPMTVGDTLRQRLDLFNRFNSEKFTTAFKAVSGAPK
jgi:hypothetical protein